jgi:hypothetical protein
MNPAQHQELVMYSYLRKVSKKGAVGFADASPPPIDRPLHIYRESDGKHWRYGAGCGEYCFTAQGTWTIEGIPKHHPA